jgi:hypothetical protein
MLPAIGYLTSSLSLLTVREDVGVRGVMISTNGHWIAPDRETPQETRQAGS